MSQVDSACKVACSRRRKPMTSKDRAIRLEIHKMHVVALLAATRIRNRWLCNLLLRVSRQADMSALLMSGTTTIPAPTPPPCCLQHSTVPLSRSRSTISPLLRGIARSGRLVVADVLRRFGPHPRPTHKTLGRSAGGRGHLTKVETS